MISDVTAKGTRVRAYREERRRQRPSAPQDLKGHRLQPVKGFFSKQLLLICLFTAALHVDVQALDLLIQSRQGHAQGLCRFGLAPVEPFQLLDDGAALEIRHNLEKGGIRRQGAVFAAPQTDAAGVQR